MKTLVSGLVRATLTGLLLRAAYHETGPWTTLTLGVLAVEPAPWGGGGTRGGREEAAGRAERLSASMAACCFRWVCSP